VDLFHRRSPEEKAREKAEELRRKQADEAAERRREQAQADAEASLAALEAGGIPVAAQRRLAELRAGGPGFFTSDLTVDEHALLRASGVRPISQVMGSSVYHVGWQANRYWGTGELETLTHAMNHARDLAVGRLEEEARRAGADAVVGVHLAMTSYEWGADQMEFQAVGTAVAVEDAPAAERPALTSLSGQDFWKLRRAGLWPVGIAGGSSVCYAASGWGASWRMASWQNIELTHFTQGWYEACARAMRRQRRAAVELGGLGVIGVRIARHERPVEVNENQTDMVFTFHAIGTAIAEAPRPSPPSPARLALDLRGRGGIRLRDPDPQEERA
jgi:uncharacterized protein YbjQ (UPF0145 family)